MLSVCRILDNSSKSCATGVHDERKILIWAMGFFGGNFTVSHRITLLLHLLLQQFLILQLIQLQDLQTSLIIL